MVPGILNLAGETECRQIQQYHEGNNRVMQGSGNMQEEACMEVMFNSVDIYWVPTMCQTFCYAGDGSEHYTVPALKPSSSDGRYK